LSLGHVSGSKFVFNGTDLGMRLAKEPQPQLLVDNHPARRLSKLSNDYELQGRMGRGGHGLPKVSLVPAKPDPSMPLGRAIPERAASRVPARRASNSLQPAWTPHTVCI
jgi:hypothetical protein